MLYNWLGMDPFAEIYDGAFADGYIEEEDEEEDDEEDWPC